MISRIQKSRILCIFLSIFLAVLLVFFFALSAYAASLPTFLEFGVAFKNARVYAQPSTKSPVVATLKKGAELEILAETKSYYLIATGNTAGYVAKTSVATLLAYNTLGLAIDSIKADDYAAGPPKLTITFRNTGKNTIDSFEVHIRGYDESGEPILRPQWNEPERLIHRVDGITLKPGKTYTLQDFPAQGLEDALFYDVGVLWLHTATGTTEIRDPDEIYWYFGPESPIFGTPGKLPAGKVLANTAIYAQPDANSKKLAKLSPGDTVSIALVRSDYYQVVSGNTYGYVPWEHVLSTESIGFGLRGSTWGASPASVKARESVPAELSFDRTTGTDMLECEILLPLSGMPATQDTWQLQYIFFSGHLKVLHITRENTGDARLLYHGFYTRLAEFEATLGEPDYAAESWVSSAPQYKKGELWKALAAGDMTMTATWERDYTQIVLFADAERCYVLAFPK